jgi:hypothetical protein
MVEFVKLTVAPELGIPLAVKLALNQMKFPPCIGVPLKLEAFEEGETQGGGVDEQLTLPDELIVAELSTLPFTTKFAVPDKEKVALKGPHPTSELR